MTLKIWDLNIRFQFPRGLKHSVSIPHPPPQFPCVTRRSFHVLPEVSVSQTRPSVMELMTVKTAATNTAVVRVHSLSLFSLFLFLASFSLSLPLPLFLSLSSPSLSLSLASFSLSLPLPLFLSLSPSLSFSLSRFSPVYFCCHFRAPVISPSLPPSLLDRNTVPIPCHSGFFQCHNGECVGDSQLCDGGRDCEDGTDEHPMWCNESGQFDT